MRIYSDPLFERGVVSEPGRDPTVDVGKCVWEYGMRLRGHSPGCQPKDGLIEVKPGTHGYHNILVYDRELTDEEIREYELDSMGVYVPHDVFKVTRIKRGVQPQSVCTDWSGGLSLNRLLSLWPEMLRLVEAGTVHQEQYQEINICLSS